ncbi:MAG: hypothetical protein IPK13_13660 [Deltaproteobacteria bacterium]|nr:hypothetical protein [Deltaproteobacteria bacterium]
MLVVFHRLGFAVLLATAASCGYGFGRAGPAAGRSLEIRPPRIQAVTPDVDVVGEINWAIGRALARSPRVALTETATTSFEIELVRTGQGLRPLAEPGLRAADYLAFVVLRGRLLDEAGRTVWRSPPVRGEARFLSRPGRVEALDGAGRTAMARAIERAVSRLVSLLLMKGKQGHG